jgi:hypothetical protein
MATLTGQKKLNSFVANTFEWQAFNIVYQSSRLYVETSTQWLAPNVSHKKIEKGMRDFTKILRSSRRDF